MEKYENSVKRLVESRKHRKAATIQSEIDTLETKARELVARGAALKGSGAALVRDALKKRYHVHAVRVLELEAELKASIAAGGVA